MGHTGNNEIEVQLEEPRRYASGFSVTWQNCVQSILDILPQSYADKWLVSMEQLLYGDGPLPYPWRIYIAILAVCRHEVTWVVRALTLEFDARDGDRKWLSGIRFAPLKLRLLDKVNKILAHKPWLLSHSHIQELTKSRDRCYERWTVTELCQAVCILAHFHALTSLLHVYLKEPSSRSFALPLTPIRTVNGNKCSSLPATIKTSPSKRAIRVETFFLNWEEIEEKERSVKRLSKSRTRGASFEDKIIVGSKRDPLSATASSKPKKDRLSRRVSFEDEIWFLYKEYNHLKSDCNYKYPEFNRSTNSLIHITEHNWQDHGFSTLDFLDFGELATQLNNRFRSLSSLSHSSWYKKEEGINQVHNAVWNLVQSFFGIHRDFYNYNTVDKILDDDIRQVIKCCSCFPDLVHSSCLPALQNDETKKRQLIPLIIVIMEAKLQSELLFALRPVLSPLL